MAGATDWQRIETLYKDARSGVFRYLLSSGFDPAKAQEATGEAFLRLHAAMSRGQSIERPRVWVYRTAHEIAETSEQPAGPSEAIAAGDGEVARLRTTLQNLSPDERALAELWAQGLRYRDIAEVIDVDLPTVGQLLGRAVRHLRKWHRCAI